MRYTSRIFKRQVNDVLPSCCSPWQTAASWTCPTYVAVFPTWSESILMTNAQRPQVFLGRDMQHGAHHLLGWWPTISLTTSTTNYAIKNNTNKPTLHPAAHTATLHTIPWFQLSLLGVSATSNFSNLPRRAKWATMGGKRCWRSLNFFEAVAVSSRTKLEGYCVQSLSICAKCVLIKD